MASTEPNCASTSGTGDSNPSTAPTTNTTTTISTIVLNSKPIQLVIALLHSGDVYHIKVVDIAPKITFLGANIDEAVHLQREHDIVFKQLQLQSSPIDEFAPKAAALLQERNDNAPQVLAAMGDSLQLAWTDVLDLLRRRKHIIDSNANLHEKIAVCTAKMSALEVACRDTMIPIEIESVQDFLNRFKQLRIEVLAAVMVALKEGNELLSCLRALANAGTLDTRPDHIRAEVKRSLTQVELWLEQLHDRRNVLELAWQTRKVQLEQCLALAIFAKELNELDANLLRRRASVPVIPNLGESESVAQHLHVEYIDHKHEALALRDKALKITRATEKLVASGCFAGDEACAKAYAVLSGCTEFLDSVDHTEHALALAREFFNKGERALGILEKLEIEVTSARNAAGSAEALAVHTQVLHEIGELTQEPLRLGYGILNDVGRSNAQLSGIERMIEDIENRKVYLEDLCSASSEKCVHITETLTMFLERHNSILSWLVSIAEAFLRQTNDLGSDLKTSTQFLKLHHQLMADLEAKGTEINNLLISVTEILGEIEVGQRHDIDQKVEALHSHWTQLKNLIEGRVDLVTVFVQFLQLAESLSNMFDYIEKMLRESPEQDRLSQLDAVWTKVKPAYEQLKSEGARFLDESSKVADPYLETKSARNCVDDILTGFSSRQFDITESWESWTHRIVELRETELLWEQTMTENVQSMNSASSKLDAQLYPILSLASTDDTGELRSFLVDKQNTVLDEINRAHLEIQQRIASTQALNVRDEQTREKVRTVLENLTAIQQKLQSVGNGYSALLESLLDYVQNIGDTRTEIERHFREQFTSVRAELVDELATAHEQFRERIMSRFRALIAQSEQLIERVRSQEPAGAKDHDTDRILGLLERLRVTFESQNGAKTLELKQQQELGRFTRELREVHGSLDEVARQLSETSSQPAGQLAEAETRRGAFQYFEKTIELLETRVTSFTRNTEQAICAVYPGTQSTVNDELLKLTARWSDLKDQVRAASKNIDLTVEYFQLGDKIEENYHNALNQLTTITKDIPNVKTETAVAAFNAGIDGFVNAHETPHLNQLKQLAQLSHHIYGFDKTVTTFNDHIALYQSFTKLKADIAAIAEQIRLEEEHRQQQLKLRDQLLEQQRQQSLLQQQQQNLLEEKLKLEQQLRAQQQHQQQQEEKLALELQQQREQQEKLLQMQQQQQQQQRLQLEQQLFEQQQQREMQQRQLELQQLQQQQQRQQLEQQLIEQQLHQQQMQAEQQQLQQQLQEQKRAAEISAAAAAAEAAAVAAAAEAAAAAAAAAVDETDKNIQTQHETMVSSQTSHKIETFTENVFESPRFVRPLADTSIQEGDRFVFTCIVTGQPQPTVEWLKDGRSIHTNADYKTVFDGAQCTLSIDEAIAADLARFTCRATNAAGQAETSAVLSVLEPAQLIMLESPVFTRLLQSGRALEGGPFEFSCCVTGNPLPTVQWFKNDLCVDHLKDFHITFNNGEALLRLDEVFLEDQAVFTCKATNPYGTEQSSALLTVDPLEPTEKPQIRVPLSNVMARVGQKIKLECTVTGIPMPEVYWTQNGKPFADRDSKLQYENDRATLLILAAFPKDAGVYVLNARNLAGAAHSTCSVTVKGRLPHETSDSEQPSDMELIKPAVQLPLKNTSVFEGKSVRLDCVIVGQPEPEVIWYHNDRPVKESQDVQLLFQGDRCTLIVQEAFLEDAGLYRVVAINSAGEANSSCELSVTPLNELDPARRTQIERLLPVAQPPRFDRLLSDILTDEGEQIEFECSVLGDPRPTVKWLLNNRPILSDDGETAAAADDRVQSVYTAEGTCKLVIRNVRQADRGVYTVKASNSCGEAKCFSHLIVKSVNAIETLTVKQREHPSAETACPTFRELFTDQTARIDESVKFECIVVGRPTPKIRWLFNDQPVQGKHFLVSRSGDRQVLSVPAVSSETVGRIACVAENEVGKATCVAGLGLSATAVPASAPAASDSANYVSGQQNYVEEYNTGSSNVTIEKKLYTSTHTSQVNSVENSSSLPQTQIHGYAAHSAEQSNQMQEYRQTNDLPATSHTRSIVNFTKPVAVPASATAVGHDFGKQQRKNLAPRFVTPFNGKIVDQGGDVLLEAIVDGYPVPELSITKNGEPLSESPNVTITHVCNKINVQLRNVNVADAGRYSVLASNVAGSSNSTADVVVKKSIFPPVFGHRLQAQVVKRNERVLMDVEVSGTPTPSVAWFKDNVPIKDAMTSEFQIKQSGNNHTLIIGSVKVADAGKYMVKAVNAAGEAQSIADFAVLEPTPDRMVEVVKTVVFDNVQNQQESEQNAHTNQNSRSTHDTNQHSTATSDSHGMIEETIVTETRRTTEATMRMEHKTQQDIPITHTQNTQTPAVALHSAGTTMTDGPPTATTAACAATNTDRPPTTVCGATQTPPQPLPKPLAAKTNGQQTADTIIDTTSISKNTSLEYFTKILDQTDNIVTPSTNGDIYRRFENIQPPSNAAETVRLHAELAEMNLLPGPPPEMGFAPKPQKPKQEQLSDRIRKLEESHKEISDIPSGGVRMLPPAIESPVFQKPAGKASLGPREPETLHSTFVDSKSVNSTTSTAHESIQSQHKYENGFTPSTPVSVASDKRAPSPRPSAQGIAMDRIWTATKPPPPPSTPTSTPAEQPSKLFDASCFHTNKNQYAEQKAIVITRKPIGTPISESDTDPPMSQYESATSDGESMHPQHPQLRRRNSTKETAQMFENKIRDMDSATLRHTYDLKAPGLVKQILPRAMPVVMQAEAPMPSALSSGIQLEPGTPPEMCYAPRMPTASERKQSLVDAIEQTIEKDFVNGPSKILAGAVRMIPPAAMKKVPAPANGVPKPGQPQQQSESVQRLYESKTYETNRAGQTNGNGCQLNGSASAQHVLTKAQPPTTGNGYLADAEDTLKRKSTQYVSTSSDSIKQSSSVFESYSSNYQKSYSTSNGSSSHTQPSVKNHSVPFAQPSTQTSHTAPHVSHGHPDHFNGTSQKEFSATTAKNISINTKQIKIAELPPHQFTPGKSARLPPTASPSKFVKSDYKESDYESDFDRRIITPVWRPSTADSDSEPLYYKPIRPVLSTPASSRPTSQISDAVCSPMPPTILDQLPKFDGPPRPKFQPIEKPKQTSPFPQPSNSKSSAQPPTQKLFKPTPVVPARPQPQPQAQRPQQPPQQQPLSTQFYTAISGPPQHIASETRNQMHMRESTETSQRIVNMTQTKRIIQFDAGSSSSSFEPKTFAVSQPTPSPQPPQQKQQQQQQPPQQQWQSHSVSRPAPTPATAATPTKFVPFEMRDTAYESEVESTRIRPLWTPNASDGDEPQYRRVNAPLASRSASMPRSTNGSQQQIPTPMEFDNKPVQLPTPINLNALPQQQPKQLGSSNQVQHKTQTLDRYSSATKTTTQKFTTTKQSSTNQTVNKQSFDLQPEAPPEYGFIGALEQQSPVAGMKATLAARTQQFMNDVAQETARRSNGHGQPQPSTSAANGGSPQAYRDESRVSQYGSKHVDPNTGLIYFKYDFGYEFGILFPGEGHKFIAGTGNAGSNHERAKSVPPRNRHSSAGDIRIPVLHERTTRPTTTPASSYYDRPASGGYASESDLSPHANGPGRGKRIVHEINIDALHGSPVHPGSGRRSVPSVQSENYNWTPELQRTTPICTPNFLQEQLPKRPPMFITPLKDIAVVNGSMARFECIVQCDPYPNIAWFRNGVPIANDGGRYSIVFRNGVCRLTIPQAFTPDAGQYTCTGTNHLGTVSTTANLIVPSDTWAQRK